MLLWDMSLAIWWCRLSSICFILMWLIVTSVSNRDYAVAVFVIVYMRAEQKSLTPVFCFCYISITNNAGYPESNLQLSICASIFWWIADWNCTFSVEWPTIQRKNHDQLPCNHNFCIFLTKPAYKHSKNKMMLHAQATVDTANEVIVRWGTGNLFIMYFMLLFDRLHVRPTYLQQMF